MFKKFTTKDLIFAALMGALMFVLSFVLGSGLNVAIGNPAASGLVSTFIQAIIMTIVILIVRKFGVVTIMWLIYGILAIPTNMLGNLPGPLKIVLALGIGIPFDAVVKIGKYKKWTLFLGFVIVYLILVPSMLYMYISLGLPQADLLLKTAPFLFVIFLVESFIGIFIGFLIYKKIQNKTFVRQIQN